ncbi:MAG: aminotransferase class I/II-fold pyridoxal phosphate-dependent enzyme [Actinobacteria bacterium]|nr:aminotransferase class I/II-fold pyridoxal phosphate-dependent enzyme [Actinomycetota bacterium]
MGQDSLAVDDNNKAVPALGPYPTKIGPEELWEIIDMWEFSEGNKERLKEIVTSDPNVRGPHLFRYYNPKPSRVEAAEKAMKDLIGAKYCLAVNSCTSALMASYRALGIGAGDEVIVPAYTFFATSATVAASNAIPVIVDIDESLCLDPEAVRKAITSRTKAIVPVHMRGAPAQMDAIMDLADRKGVPVIEDVAQAGGGSFDGKRLGSIGTMGCFSFDYYKVIVSGEGGFITTNDEWLYTRAQNWHDCAACWRPDRFARERKEGELFCGENYRMSELEGAVALAQIRKADEKLAGYRRAKRQIKEAIESFSGLSFRRLNDKDGDVGICLIMFLSEPDITRKATEALKDEGVPAGGIYDSKVRDWHVYSYWEHILDRKSVSADGLPWSAVSPDELPKYSRQMCPRTLDLLGRAIMVDIDYNYSETDCENIGLGINKVMRALLG